MGALIQAWISDEEFKMLEEMEQYFEELQDRDFGGKAYLNNY